MYLSIYQLSIQKWQSVTSYLLSLLALKIVVIQLGSGIVALGTIFVFHYSTAEDEQCIGRIILFPKAFGGSM